MDAQQALARFQAKDGTGSWEVFIWGFAVIGKRFHF